MDASTIIVVFLLLAIVAAAIAVPVWIVRRLLRWGSGARERGPNGASRKSSRLTYQEQIGEAKAALLVSHDQASLPVLDPAEIGYRPVSSERLLAVQNGAKRMAMKSTGRYRTVGMSVSIPIVKGVRYRIGTGSIKSDRSWQVTGRGRLIITDKAVAFEGSDKNERITWRQIADVELLKDGFQIAKRSGPARTYVVDRPDPQFAAVLELMLARTD